MFIGNIYFFPWLDTLNWKNVVLVLGRKVPQDADQFGESAGSLFVSHCVCAGCLQCAVFICCPADKESVLMVWNSSLPMEVKDLNKHCEKREQIAARMREQLH